MDDAATLADLHESVTTLEEVERTARRVLGGAHPATVGIEHCLQGARAVRAHVAASGDMSSIRKAMEAMMSGDAK